jgi:hypothetical protein
MHQILKDLLPKIHRRSRVSCQVCKFSVFESQVGHRLYWLIYFMIFLSPKIKSENSTLNWATTYLLSSKIWDHMVRVSRLFVKLQNYKFVPEGHKRGCTLTLAAAPSMHRWKFVIAKVEFHMPFSAEAFSSWKAWSWKKIINKLFQSNTTIFYFWRHVSVIMPSSGHLYIKFKTRYM